MHILTVRGLVRRTSKEKLSSCIICHINCGFEDELNQEPVDRPLDRLELALELTVLGGGHARGNDRSRDIASAS
jgi:hypothetical protein